MYFDSFLFRSPRSECAPRLILNLQKDTTKTSGSVPKRYSQTLLKLRSRLSKCFLCFLPNWPMQLSKSNSVICFLVNRLRVFVSRLAFSVLFLFLSRFALRVSILREASSFRQPPAMVVSVRFINQGRALSLLSTYERPYFHFASLFVCDSSCICVHFSLLLVFGIYSEIIQSDY